MKKALWILVLLLTIYSLLVTQKAIQLNNRVFTSDTIYIKPDTVFSTNTIDKPTIIEKEVPKDRPVYVTDSNCMEEYAKLYLEHFSRKVTRDTLRNDTSMTIVVTAYVLANNIDSIKVASKNNRPSQTIINHVDEDMFYKSDYTWGTGIYAGYKTFTPYVSYKPKDNLEFYVGYDVINKSPQAGINYRFYRR